MSKQGDTDPFSTARPAAEQCGAGLEIEHARLLQQGWRRGPDGCYRKSAQAPAPRPAP